MKMKKKQSLLLDVYKRDDGVCFWCDRMTALSNNVQGEPILPSAATIDHITPLSKDGALLDTSNILLACFRCNCLRGNRDFDDFLDDPHRPGALDTDAARFRPLGLEQQQYRIHRPLSPSLPHPRQEIRRSIAESFEV